MCGHTAELSPDTSTVATVPTAPAKFDELRISSSPDEREETEFSDNNLITSGVLPPGGSTRATHRKNNQNREGQRSRVNGEGLVGWEQICKTAFSTWGSGQECARS